MRDSDLHTPQIPATPVQRFPTLITTQQ